MFNMEGGDIDFDPLDEPGKRSANFDYDDDFDEEEVLGWFDDSEDKPLLPSEEIQMKEFNDRVETKSGSELRYRGPKSSKSETSFITGELTEEAKREARIKNEMTILKRMYPEGERVINDLILDIEKKGGELKVVVIGLKGKVTGNLFKKGGTVNERAIGKVNFRDLGPRKMTYQQAEEEVKKDFDKLQSLTTENENLREEIKQNEDYANLATTSEEARERAEEKNEALEERIDENQAEIDQTRERLGFTLRERIREIFKKYGLTVTAIALSFTAVIAAIVHAIQQNALTKGLKKMAGGIGKGLKNIGKKLAEILPGLLGSIASFIFKTAGSIISFLGKHAWLLIVAVVAFMMERLMKK